MEPTTLTILPFLSGNDSASAGFLLGALLTLIIGQRAMKHRAGAGYQHYLRKRLAGIESLKTRIAGAHSTPRQYISLSADTGRFTMGRCR